MQKQIWLFSEWNVFYKSFKTKSRCVIRLHSGKSIFIILASFDVNPSVLVLCAKIAFNAVKNCMQNKLMKSATIIKIILDVIRIFLL